MSHEGVAQRPEFDPRFPKAFQPGYDASVDGARRSVLRTSASAPAAAAEEREVLAESTPEPPDASAPVVVTATPTVVSAPGAPLAVLASDPAEEPEPHVDRPVWWRRINPWVAALAAGGLVLILVGLWWGRVILEGSFIQSSREFGNEWATFMYQWSILGLPLVIAVGVLMLALAGLVLALRWRPRDGR